MAAHSPQPTVPAGKTHALHRAGDATSGAPCSQARVSPVGQGQSGWEQIRLETHTAPTEQFCNLKRNVNLDKICHKRKSDKGWFGKRLKYPGLEPKPKRTRPGPGPTEQAGPNPQARLLGGLRCPHTIAVRTGGCCLGPRHTPPRTPLGTGLVSCYPPTRGPPARATLVGFARCHLPETQVPKGSRAGGNTRSLPVPGSTHRAPGASQPSTASDLRTLDAHPGGGTGETRTVSAHSWVPGPHYVRTPRGTGQMTGSWSASEPLPAAK